MNISYFGVQFFVLDLLLNFQRLSEDDVYTQLDRIADMADEGAENSEYIGALTTNSRTNWANAREQLLKGKLEYLFLSTH